MALLSRSGSGSLSGSLSRSSSLGLPSSTAPRLVRRKGHGLPSRLQRAQTCGALPSADDLPGPASSSPDHFAAAGRRLQSLLSRVGDGEEEMLDSMVEQEAPESRLQTSVLLGGAVTLGAVVIASLVGQDPWGGAGLNWETLSAAATGAAVAAPLVALREWTWSPKAREVLPAIQDVHAGQLETHRPWLSRMSRPQVAAMMALEVLPTTLLMFPAGQAAITAGLAMYGKLIGSAPAVDSGAFMANSDQVFALALTALLVGVGRSLDLSASEEQYQTVQAAAQNADRYYRTMATDMHSGPGEAAKAAEAFRYVTQAWMQTKADASLLAGLLAALDVAALGLLWYGTGNLAAPALAALALNGVDFWHLHGEVLRAEAKVGRHGTGGSA